MNKLTVLKAKYWRGKGNRAIREAKTELERNSNTRESLLADFAKLDQAIADLHTKHSMVDDAKEAQSLVLQIGHFERTRRNLRTKFNEIVATQEAQEQQLSEMEGQFRALEGMMDEKQKKNLS